MRRRLVAALSGSDRIRAIAESAGLQDGVARYVAGPTVDDAVRVVGELRQQHVLSSVGWLREPAADPTMAAAAGADYVDLLTCLAANPEAAERGLGADVALSTGPIGLGLAGGDAIVLAHARTVCGAARNLGVSVTVGMAGHRYTSAVLAVADELWADYPDVGVSVQAALRRTQSDCLALASRRVRLLKGGRDAAANAVFPSRAEIDRSFVRCLRVLMAGPGNPVVATHDRRLVRIATALADREGRARDSFEIQLRYGVDSAWRDELVAEGHRVRVLVPFGADWFPILVSGAADAPGDLRFFLRSLAAGAWERS